MTDERYKHLLTVAEVCGNVTLTKDEFAEFSPVVRCKDCKWSDCKILQSTGINNYDGIIWCYFHGADFKYDFFCAGGERKTDGGGIKL